jgi:valyl-tRNA synthetase
MMSLWLPGMDHAGIATQAKVEARLREEGVSRYDIGQRKILGTCMGMERRICIDHSEPMGKA